MAIPFLQEDRLQAIEQFLKDLVAHRPLIAGTKPCGALLAGVPPAMESDIAAIAETVAGATGRMAFFLNFRELFSRPLLPVRINPEKFAGIDAAERGNQIHDDMRKKLVEVDAAGPS